MSDISTTQPYNPHRSYLPIYARRSTPRSGYSTTSGRKFTKSVVLVSSDEKEVPRGNRRQQLQTAGAIVDLIDFYTDWSESKVRQTIEEALGELIDSSQPQPR